MSSAALGRLIAERALLHGDFVLRSGKRSNVYLDKYRFETDPALLRPIGEALAAAAREHDPEAVRLAGPELGAVPLATAAALASGLPFLIVRSSAKAYGTARRIEGVYEPGERVLLVEDVVTAGGAALEAVRALRSEGLEVARALCVLDRAEGGAAALAEEGVELRSLLTRADVGMGGPESA